MWGLPLNYLSMEENMIYWNQYTYDVYRPLYKFAWNILFLLFHLTLLINLVDEKRVFDTIRKSLKFFKEFNNEVKGRSLKV